MATTLLAALATPSLAQCPGPAGQGGAYGANGLDTTLCLQGDLSADTRYRADQTRIDAALRDLQLDLQRQQINQMALQSTLGLTPLPPGF